MKRLIENSRTVFLWLLFAFLISGCASNEELFAQYEHQCRVGVIANATGVAIFEEISGKTMQWEPAVYFKLDKASLSEDELHRLDTNIAVLNEYPELKIYIRGFTDSIASQAYNLELAQRRVDTVQNYLHSKGIDTSRLLTDAAGESLPLLNNETYESRAVNRRVEITLLDQFGRPAPLVIGSEPIKSWVQPNNISEPGKEDLKNRKESLDE